MRNKDLLINLTIEDFKRYALQSCLEMPDNGKSRWWYFLRDWNEDTDNPNIPIDTALPDYTNLIKTT